MKPIVRWFADLGRTDTAEAGGKGANLGELTKAGLPVPQGFVVTASAYLASMDAGGVRAELQECFADTRERADDPEALAQGAARLRDLVRKAGLRDDVRNAVREAFEQLGTDVAVAVRSSATAEDTAGASYAGMHETYANVVGETAVLDRVLDCWTSLYGERVISYRAGRGFTEEPAIAVVVQRMVQPDTAGVMFTADPSTGSRDHLVIEAAFGLGEVVVSGQVEPDTYVLSKDGLRLESIRVGHKTHQLVSGPNGSIERIDFDEAHAAARVLTDGEIFELGRLGRHVEAAYGGVPQDVEWVICGGAVSVVQARPITTLDPTVSPPSGEQSTDATLLLRGLAASVGIASGRVRVLRTPAEGAKLQPGEVLVAPMTNPDWVPAIRRAAAVVTDGGGATCHAAIVSRELGVPCVVGTRTATADLHDGDVVTVDGARGTVSRGCTQDPRSCARRPWSELVRPRRGRRARGPRDTHLRQPRHRRSGRGRGRTPGRRRRSAARRVHGHRRTRWRPSASGDRQRRR